MKHFLFFVFLFCSLIINAQAVEEIAYIPSSSGNYDNLVVKGDTQINELVTPAFNLHSYGSLLTVRTLNDAIKVANLNISTGTASLIFNNNTDVGTNTSKVTVKGGSISLTKNTTIASNVLVQELAFPKKVNVDLYLNARNAESKNNSTTLMVNNLFIFGMRVPECENNYYWQKVYSEQKESNKNIEYEILVCNPTKCNAADLEKTCSGNWNASTCECN